MSVHNFQKNRTGAACGLVFALGLASAAALAQGTAVSAFSLPDPTRPPAGFVDELPTGGIGARAVESGSTAVGPDADAPRSGLQSVVLPRYGKPVAIIDGKYVMLGEQHGGYELVSLTETEAVLVKGKVRRVLRLTPGVAKRPARMAPSTAPVSKRQDPTPGKAAPQGLPRKTSETNR